MKRCIKVTPEQRRELERRFDVSDTFVYESLAYNQNGETAKKIREAAIEMGGTCVDPTFIPNCRTEYLEGQIRQTFAAGVVLTIDRKTGMATITIGGEVVRKVDEAVRISSWNILAQEAQQLAIRRIVTSTPSQQYYDEERKGLRKGVRKTGRLHLSIQEHETGSGG